MDAALTEEVVRQWISIDEDDLRNNEFKPKMIWRDENGDMLLFMLPDMKLRWDGREDLAKATMLLTASLPKASTITFMADSWAASPHPETGKMTRMDGRPWAPGGMEYAVTHNTIDAPLVREVITYTVVDREANVSSAGVMYKRNPDGSLTFEWDDMYLDSCGPHEKRGLIADILRDAVEVPPLSPATLMEKMPSRFASDAIDVAIKVAAVKMVMKNTGFPCILAARNEEESKLIQDAFGEEDGFKLEVHRPGGAE